MIRSFRRMAMASVLAGVCMGLTDKSAAVTLSRKDSLPTQDSVNGLSCAVIDPTAGFAYFGSTYTVAGSTSSRIAKIQLSDFSYAATTGTVLIHTLSAAAIDSAGTYGYFASSQSPAAIQKIDLAGFVLSSSATLPTGLDFASSGLIDATGAYFAVQNAGVAAIVKVGLTDLALISSVTVSLIGTLPSAVIDVAGGYAYFGSSLTAGGGGVVKVRLSDLSVQTLTFTPAAGAATAAVIDPSNGFAYFGTDDSPAKVIKVRLSDLTEVARLDFDAGQNRAGSGVVDLTRGRAYFGTRTSSGVVVEVQLSDLQRGATVELAAGENDLTSAVIDVNNAYAYFGTNTSPGIVIRLDLLTGAPEITQQPRTTEIRVGQDATFAVEVIGRAPLTYQWQLNNVNIAGATGATYVLPAVTLDNNDYRFRCVITNGLAETTTSQEATLVVLPDVHVYPNPWRADRHAGLPITFKGVPASATVKIFSLGAHWVANVPLIGDQADWQRINDAGQKVASGYYFYVVKCPDNRQTVRGTLAIIK